MDVEISDIPENPAAAAQYGVWSLPATIVLDAQRKVIAIKQGVAHEHRWREQIARAEGAEQLLDRRGEIEWQPS